MSKVEDLIQSIKGAMGPSGGAMVPNSPAPPAPAPAPAAPGNVASALKVGPVEYHPAVGLHVKIRQ